MSTTSDTRKIMTKPLPEILDEIENMIGLADEAAKNARQAALEAHKAGQKAVEDATKAVSKRIVKNEEAIVKNEEAIIKNEEAIVKHEEVIAKHEEAIVKHEEVIVRHDEDIVKIEESKAKANVSWSNRFEQIEELIRVTNIQTNIQINEVQQIATNALQLAELLKSAVMDGVIAVDKRITEKIAETESAPKPAMKSASKPKSKSTRKGKKI